MALFFLAAIQMPTIKKIATRATRPYSKPLNATYKTLEAAFKLKVNKSLKLPK